MSPLLTPFYEQDAEAAACTGKEATAECWTEMYAARQGAKESA